MGLRETQKIRFKRDLEHGEELDNFKDSGEVLYMEFKVSIY